jgi:hypothetical protein
MNIEDIEEAIYEQTQEFVPQCVYKAILNLIAAEREACARVCDDYDVKYDVCGSDTAEGIALQIRARGNT